MTKTSGKKITQEQGPAAQVLKSGRTKVQCETAHNNLKPRSQNMGRKQVQSTRPQRTQQKAKVSKNVQDFLTQGQNTVKESTTLDTELDKVKISDLLPDSKKNESTNLKQDKIMTQMLRDKKRRDEKAKSVPKSIPAPKPELKPVPKTEKAQITPDKKVGLQKTKIQPNANITKLLMQQKPPARQAAKSQEKQKAETLQKIDTKVTKKQVQEKKICIQQPVKKPQSPPKQVSPQKQVSPPKQVSAQKKQPAAKKQEEIAIKEDKIEVKSVKKGGRSRSKDVKSKNKSHQGIMEQLDKIKDENVAIDQIKQQPISILEEINKEQKNAIKNNLSNFVVKEQDKEMTLINDILDESIGDKIQLKDLQKVYHTFLHHEKQIAKIKSNIFDGKIESFSQLKSDIQNVMKDTIMKIEEKGKACSDIQKDETLPTMNEYIEKNIDKLNPQNDQFQQIMMQNMMRNQMVNSQMNNMAQQQSHRLCQNGIQNQFNPCQINQNPISFSNNLANSQQQSQIHFMPNNVNSNLPDNTSINLENKKRDSQNVSQQKITDFSAQKTKGAKAKCKTNEKEKKKIQINIATPKSNQKKQKESSRSSSSSSGSNSSSQSEQQNKKQSNKNQAAKSQSSSVKVKMNPKLVPQKRSNQNRGGQKAKENKKIQEGKGGNSLRERINKKQQLEDKKEDNKEMSAFDKIKDTFKGKLDKDKKEAAGKGEEYESKHTSYDEKHRQSKSESKSETESSKDDKKSDHDETKSQKDNSSKKSDQIAKFEPKQNVKGQPTTTQVFRPPENANFTNPSKPQVKQSPTNLRQQRAKPAIVAETPKKVQNKNEKIQIKDNDKISIDSSTQKTEKDAKKSNSQSSSSHKSFHVVDSKNASQQAAMLMSTNKLKKVNNGESVNSDGTDSCINDTKLNKQKIDNNIANLQKQQEQIFENQLSVNDKAKNILLEKKENEKKAEKKSDSAEDGEL